jgi:cytoskeleton protein RodZ
LTGGLLMSDIQTSSANEQDIQADPVEPVAQQSAGELLKQAREAAGLHIAALAVLLKVPVKKLEALEANRLDLLPDAVFIRALASSVCRTLKIDAAPVLARLPQTHAPKLTYQGAGINAPFSSPGDGPGPTIWAQVSRPAVLAGLVLMLGALVLIFLPAIKTGVNDVKSDVMDARPAGAVEAKKANGVNMVIAEPEKSAPSVLPSNAPLVSVVPTTSTDAATLVPAPAAVSASAAAGMSAGMSAPTSVVAPKPPSAADVVVFTAKGQSWVEATDAKGQVVLRRVLNAGEVAGAAGELPLKVVIGRANETQVQIRGKAFDVNAVAKDNVARFEVK